MTPPDPTRRIMIAGGSGLIGRHLAAALVARGDEVLVLSRHPASAQTRLPGCAVLRWHPGSDGRWRDELDVVDAVVDVSGAPFFTRWRGDYYTRKVLGSRRSAIQSLIEAIARASVCPKVLVSTSSLGPYGFRRDDQVLTERSRPDIGPLSRDALELEACALKAEASGTRVVLLRPGVVLAPDGGAFQMLTQAFERGLGAPVTPGTQWCSWIHIADTVELIITALDHEHAQGPLNLTSPNPVSNREFAEAFARATSRPLRPPIPRRALHLIFGKAAIVISHGQRVLPARALGLGHEFKYPELTGALNDLISRAHDRSDEPRPEAALDHRRLAAR
jgi:uncharacterized protein (TIGR01777 family)